MTCKDLATAIGRDEWRAARRWRRLTLRLHLLMCSHCRCYAAQIRAIGTAVRSLFQKPGEDAKILERLQETILGRPETNLDPSEIAISRPRQPRQTAPVHSP